MPYEQLDDASYSNLRRRLLEKKGSALQIAFLNALRTGGDFPQWLREKKIEVTPGDHLPVVDGRLTESEFTKPPRDTERQLFESWSAITPAVACRTTFWGCVTLRHIEEGRIAASYLAADNLRTSGTERIARAVRDGGEIVVDGVVRTVLRRMSGLRERGNRSVYVDCPFARAWWRHHVANEVRRATGGQAEERTVLRALRRSAYWTNLIDLVVSRNSILGDTNVRAALIWSLAESVAPDPHAPEEENPRSYLSESELQRVVRLIGIRSAWQELGVFPLDRLKALIEQEFLAGLVPERTEPAARAAAGG